MFELFFFWLGGFLLGSFSILFQLSKFFSDAASKTLLCWHVVFDFFFWFGGFSAEVFFDFATA